MVGCLVKHLIHSDEWLRLETSVFDSFDHLVDNIF